MKIKILGFSKGAYGRIDGPVFLLASGNDVELREGDEVEITVTHPTLSAADLPKPCAVCGSSKHHTNANGIVVPNTANR